MNNILAAQIETLYKIKPHQKKSTFERNPMKTVLKKNSILK